MVIRHVLWIRHTRRAFLRRKGHWYGFGTTVNRSGVHMRGLGPVLVLTERGDHRIKRNQPIFKRG